MNYLTDTHIFLWSLLSSQKLSQKVKGILLDPQDTKYVSAITFWEISLKFQLGKLGLSGIFPDKLPNLAKEAGFEILNLDCETASSFYKLPKLVHKDPFDRLLAWQAIRQDFPLLTKDPGFKDYKGQGLKTVW